MAALLYNQQPVLNRLRLRWGFFAALCLAFVAGGYALLASQWQPAYAARWAALVSPALLYLLVVFWRGLPDNHRHGEQSLLPILGAGNLLTLLRGVLVAGLVGFLFSPRPGGWLAWVPAVLYTLADVSDYFDGYLARRADHATRLGEKLDMSFDGLGVLAASLLAVLYGQAPAWYLLVAFARYFFLALTWALRRLGRPVYELPPSISRRAFAGVQMGFLAVILWPLFSPPATHLAAALFAAPFLAGFLRDGLYTAGVLRPGKSLPSQAGQFLSRWLPVLLRLAVLGLAAATLPALLLTESQPLPFIFLALEGMAALMLVAGIAGRVAAILALCLLGIRLLGAGLEPASGLLVAAYTALLYLGTGALSLWTPEEWLIHHKAGERAGG